MPKLTKEEHAERLKGYRAGRSQGSRGLPWSCGTRKSNVSDVYRHGHRDGYLLALKAAGIEVEPTEPKPRVFAAKPPSDKRLADTWAKGRESGFSEGFKAALETLAPSKRRRGSVGEWSDEKMTGYQWGYRQAKAGNPPHSSGDLRSDPQFNEGYEMGYSAGSKILKSA